jgi:hypothetical protein
MSATTIASVISQSAARELLKPCGFVLAETLKRPDRRAVERVLRQAVGDPWVIPALEDHAVTVLRAGAWLQVWRDDRSARWRLVLVEPMTMMIVRVLELWPNPLRLVWPASDTDLADLVAEAGFGR